MITSDEIKRRLWDGANELRGSMDASRYKDYMLGLMFYKFLSDKTIDTFRMTSGMKQQTEKEVIEAYHENYQQYGDQLVKMISDVLGYYVLPEHLYQTWISAIRTGEFEVQKVTDSLNNFERTIAITGDSDDFKGLFSSSTLDLTDTALGSNLNERNKNIKELVLLFADLNMVALQKGDVLGNAYEYLIGQFAMESGKKAGEFYTPPQVSEVMAQIVAKTKSIKSIYDPTVGSGSLLLTVSKYLSEDEKKRLAYYGQEKNTATYNLTRMNLLLHGVRPEKMTISNGDTLAEDWPEDPQRPNDGVQFDAVVMNPPYSVKNWNKSNLKISDPRFEVAGVLPPDSKGDYAFLLHGLFHLGQQGTMAIVLPHGVLFRGGSEGEIRKRLLAKNYIDTIIGLPDKLFTNTGIPVTVLILKKDRPLGAPVLMIDASKTFVKEGKQNVLQEKDIAKIVDAYATSSEEVGYSHLATRDEIIENDYNLNIPRYIETIDGEVSHDVDAHLYGGIPSKNITELKVLQESVPTIIKQALKEVRSGYVELTEPIEALTKKVLNDDHVSQKSKAVEQQLKVYLDKYWELLKTIDDVNGVTELRDAMLLEIKELLLAFKHINEYDGYQIIAEIWKEKLTEDAEIIALTDFYTAGRTRVPLMVTKGTGKKKREEQDGWIGSIVSNDLIKKQLFSEDVVTIEEKEAGLSEVEAELMDLVEAAKVEDSDEESALSEVLNDKEDAFTIGLIRSLLKEATKGNTDYTLLKKVEDLLNGKTNLSREVKKLNQELKEATESRIETLTNEEIDNLMYEKWFGSLVSKVMRLVENPLTEELAVLEQLQNRYSDTLTTLEEEGNQLEQELEEMMQQLVVNES
ncbi:type I restriction enzyme M protein [Carnobacterium iners]|uniref:site-specific DNA-methyltransferase (adenine-specific) n=1 Tax=Carnobacterium iners TaxID=1073423 RepID=A0A1X7MQ24_9LACT|nr:type I restriction-modification system subunit M [Carnobacterium iners]SEL05426.1 type I restriction enzyme M protein [Carnobacterium iners]SMH26939.1 type I restriction enzyme M protein [Carnobacterium iners]